MAIFQVQWTLPVFHLLSLSALLPLVSDGQIQGLVA
jgi:hypothetical protein